MMNNAVAIMLILAAIEGIVLFVASHEKTKRYFRFMPPVFWIYFLPMLASSCGLIDAGHPVLGAISKHVLPASLFLLLLAVDVKAILRLGPKALTMMLAGSLGIMLGTTIVFYLFRDIVGAQMWSGFAALSGSWSGGSANMIAVKEALLTPDEVFLPMVIVDTVVPYFWMGILISAVSLQPVFDKFARADQRILDELDAGTKVLANAAKARLRPSTTVIIILVAFAGGALAMATARFLPEIKDVVSATAWTIIAASTLGLAASFTPAKRLEEHGSERIGYILLYFVLTSIGAKASVSNIGDSLVLIVAGFLIVLLHAVFLIVTARLIRAPMFLAAVASQANIGGVASAPIVAEVYRPGLASVGLLLAVLGGIIGTYLGIITGHMCRLF
jgi:uncharacterized membrane protein